MAVLLRLCCGLVVALSLTHGAHAWTPVGALENPRNNSSQSGIGLISGWVCNAFYIDVQINGVSHLPSPRDRTPRYGGGLWRYI